MKKSEVLHEGFINGLKTAQKMITQMINESIIDIQKEILEWCDKVNDIIENVNEVSMDDDDFDACYYNNHIPIVSINDDGYDLLRISYNSDDDMLYIETEKGNLKIDVFNFSLYFRKAERAAHGNMVFKNVEGSINGDESKNFNLTVYLA